MSSKTKRNEEENVYMNYDRVHPCRPDDPDAFVEAEVSRGETRYGADENAISDAVHEIRLPGAMGPMCER